MVLIEHITGLFFRRHNRRLRSQKWTVTTLGGDGQASEPDPHQDSLSQCQLRRLKQWLPPKSIQRYRLLLPNPSVRGRCWAKPTLKLFFSLGRWKEDQKTRRRSPCCCVSSFSVFRIFFLSNFNDFEKNICARNFWYLISLLSLLHFWKGVFLNCSLPHPPQSNPVLAESLFLKKYYRVQTWYLRVLKLDSSVLKRERDTIGLWHSWSCYGRRLVSY